MVYYTVRRIVQIVIVFFVATFLIFAIVRILPGDPIQAQFGERRIPDNLRDAYIDRYNLDEPLWKQYVLYMKGIFTGDFGESISKQRPVSDIFREAFPRTARLALLAVFFQALIGIPIGIRSALKRQGLFDNSMLVVTIIMLSIPVFVLANLAQYWIGVKWGILPVAGIEDGWKSYILPALVIATSSAAITARLMRTTLIETMGEDYIRTARSKGLPERKVISGHAMRNALIPVITVLAIDLGALLGGTLVTEAVFNIPGVGLEIVRAIPARDNTIIVGISLMLVLLYLVINLIVDLMYAWLDPRIRYE